jgi:hypothetical protein
MSVDRIFIGGLDPPRLTGEDIVRRLKSLDIEVLSVIDKKNKPFLHLTATSKGSESALEIISKTYNNVKWKGCKISVAEARPHFLERLVMERKELAEAAQQSEMQQQEPVTAPPDEENHPTNNIPRRLKVRKKFGDAAYHVDTKPWSVDNWSSFSKASGKLRNRVKKYNLKTKEIKDPSVTMTPLMHRAAHIRFESSAAESRVVVHSQSSSDEESVDEKSSASDSDSDSSDEKPFVREPEDDVVAAKPQVIEKDGYQWSSDSSSDSSSDESSVHITRNRPFQDVTTADEFAAGLGMDSDNDDSDGDEPNQMEQNLSERKSHFDMDNDVSSNLNALAGLFPDMAYKSPALVDDKPAGADGTLDKSATASKSIFGRGAMMPRYDPNDVSTKKYEVQDEVHATKEALTQSEDEKSHDEDAHSNVEETDSDGEKEEIYNDQEPSKEEASPVYHQGKLENVFREARSAWEGQTNQPAQNDTESGGAFTFGFDLGKPSVEAASNDNADGFTFKFDLPPESTINDSLKRRQDERNVSASEDMDVDTPNDAEAPVDEKRRRGIRFSMEELESHQTIFFAYNEGERIMKDLQGFRSDGEVKEHWLKQRQTLTLDWKNKRKHAMSRIQKRMKFR